MVNFMGLAGLVNTTVCKTESIFTGPWVGKFSYFFKQYQSNRRNIWHTFPIPTNRLHKCHHQFRSKWSNRNTACREASGTPLNWSCRDGCIPNPIKCCIFIRCVGFLYRGAEHTKDIHHKIPISENVVDNRCLSLENYWKKDQSVQICSTANKATWYLSVM